MKEKGYTEGWIPKNPPETDNGRDNMSGGDKPEETKKKRFCPNKTQNLGGKRVASKRGQIKGLFPSVLNGKVRLQKEREANPDEKVSICKFWEGKKKEFRNSGRAK